MVIRPQYPSYSVHLKRMSGVTSSRAAPLQIRADDIKKGLSVTTSASLLHQQFHTQLITNITLRVRAWTNKKQFPAVSSLFTRTPSPSSPSNSYSILEFNVHPYSLSFPAAPRFLAARQLRPLPYLAIHNNTRILSIRITPPSKSFYIIRNSPRTS